MKALIKQLLEEGNTFAEISRHKDVGVSRERVRQIAKAEGWKRRPFFNSLPKVPTELQLLKASGKPWCQKCKVQDVEFSGRLCNPCNSKRANDYYHTDKGKEAINRAKANYAKRKKGEESNRS